MAPKTPRMIAAQGSMALAPEQVATCNYTEEECVSKRKDRANNHRVSANHWEIYLPYRQEVR
jgi:hypothetical protein